MPNNVGAATVDEVHQNIDALLKANPSSPPKVDQRFQSFITLSKYKNFNFYGSLTAEAQKYIQSFKPF